MNKSDNYDALREDIALLLARFDQMDARLSRIEVDHGIALQQLQIDVKPVALLVQRNAEMDSALTTLSIQANNAFEDHKFYAESAERSTLRMPPVKQNRGASARSFVERRRDYRSMSPYVQ